MKLPQALSTFAVAVAPLLLGASHTGCAAEDPGSQSNDVTDLTNAEVDVPVFPFCSAGVEAAIESEVRQWVEPKTRPGRDSNSDPAGYLAMIEIMVEHGVVLEAELQSYNLPVVSRTSAVADNSFFLGDGMGTLYIRPSSTSTVSMVVKVKLDEANEVEVVDTYFLNSRMRYECQEVASIASAVCAPSVTAAVDDQIASWFAGEFPPRDSHRGHFDLVLDELDAVGLLDGSRRDDYPIHYPDLNSIASFPADWSFLILDPFRDDATTDLDTAFLVSFDIVFSDAENGQVVRTRALDTLDCSRVR